MSISANRINKILKKSGGGRYLEIGVHSGDTFLKVDAHVKVAVDPEFQFNTAAHASDGVFFYAVPSDAFFDGFESLPAAEKVRDADGVPRFDVIFIDGLHTFEQSYRDFLHSLRYAHDNTVWIIDDTVPNDPYSALPDAEKCFFYRSHAGLFSESWHGDVYKTTVAIHDLHKDFFFRTVIDAGNPQTVAWRCPGKTSSRAGLCGDLAAIGRLGYFDIAEHAHALMFGADATLPEALFTPDTSVVTPEDATVLFFYDGSEFTKKADTLLKENAKLARQVELLRKEVERLSS